MFLIFYIWHFLLCSWCSSFQMIFFMCLIFFLFLWWWIVGSVCVTQFIHAQVVRLKYKGISPERPISNVFTSYRSVFTPLTQVSLATYDLSWESQARPQVVFILFIKWVPPPPARPPETGPSAGHRPFAGNRPSATAVCRDPAAGNRPPSAGEKGVPKLIFVFFTQGKWYSKNRQQLYISDPG